MSQDRHDSLLNKDWSDAWDSLPEAPELVSRPKTAQITMRIPTRLLARIKAVAATKSLPYHALSRSWVIEAMRSPGPPINGVSADEPQAEQLNIKLDNETLDELKERADKLRRPYHRLAREWIEAALTREEESLGIDPSPAGRPKMKDLMVLLLHAADHHGEDALRGMTRLQKLLFVIEQKLAADHSRFYAYNYGPFNEEVNDAAEALKLQGLLQSPEAVSASRPTFAEMMASAMARSGPREDATPAEDFVLSKRGHEAAERLRRSNRAYEQLFAYIRELRQEWDTPDLVERVYDTWPKMAEKSLIKDEVASRRGRRRRQ
jgi:predicted DNA binding CopG/RHH family protein